MADAENDSRAHRRTIARRAFAIGIVAMAFCCGTSKLGAQGYLGAEGFQAPSSLAPTSRSFQALASFQAPASRGVVRLASAPGSWPIAGPSITSRATGTSYTTGPSFEQLLDRLDRQDQVIGDLQRRLGVERLPASVPTWTASGFSAAAYAGSSAAAYGGSYDDACGCVQPPNVYAPLLGNADDGKCAPCGQEKTFADQHVVSHYVGYDKGFVIRPFNFHESPFELKINGRIQFRHHAFTRDVNTWTDNAGVTRDVRRRNAFDVERARLVFSGTVLDPRSSFYMQIDGDTDGGHALDFLDFSWAWKFSDLLQVRVGKRKVPGSRQWLLSSSETMFVDRTVATDFFRPDRTVGIWFRGDLSERTHYQAMIGNGYQTTNLAPSQQNDKFAYAATHWIDLGAEAFGKAFSDYECHVTPVGRLGHSLTVADQSDTVGGVPLDEADFVRLSDGTVLDDPNALAAGTRVDAFDIYMYAIDAAWKYRGYSLNGEIFFRWLEDIDGTGNIPVTDIFDHGFYVQGSRYLVPKTVYIAARVSQVTGPYGDHYEFAAAVNWFMNSSRTLQLTFDVTALDGSPLNNTSSDVLVGDDGVLFRTQFQAKF